MSPNSTVSETPVGLAMPKASAQARRFGKARRERSIALLEDYIELIADLFAADGEARAADVARRLGVTQPSAGKAIERLKRKGLVSGRPYRGLFLTELGRKLADALRARRRLVVDFLIAVGAPAEAAEMDAEGIEHHVSRATLKVFERYIAEHRQGHGSGRIGLTR